MLTTGGRSIERSPGTVGAGPTDMYTMHYSTRPLGSQAVISRGARAGVLLHRVIPKPGMSRDRALVAMSHCHSCSDLLMIGSSLPEMMDKLLSDCVYANAGIHDLRPTARSNQSLSITATKRLVYYPIPISAHEQSFHDPV